MTLNVSTIGENPQQPGIYAETFIPDQLIAGNLKIVSQPIVLAAGTLPRGSVLGQVSSSSVVATPGTNTGNGTVSALSAGAGAKVGPYVLLATAPTVFSVTDPEGNVLANAAVGTAYSAGGINFLLTAGGTAFVAGDSFSLLVDDSIGNFILSVKTASDGSQVPCAVLADFADASLGPVTTGAYVMAEVNGNRLNYDPSWTIQTLTTALRPFGLFVKNSVSAADPS
jgi:hypothetical protein